MKQNTITEAAASTLARLRAYIETAKAADPLVIGLLEEAISTLEDLVASFTGEP